MPDTAERRRARRRGTARTLLGPPDDATLAELMNAAVRHAVVDRLGVASARVAALDVGRVEPGEASVEQVRLRGLRFRLRCGSAVLRNVRAIVELGFSAEWRYDLKWLGSDGGVKSLGSKASTIELHDIRLPMLEDFVFELPEVALEGIAATLDPIEDLVLGATRVAGLELEGTRLPREGFAVSGLDLGPVELRGARVPGTATRALRVEEVAPEAPLRLPRLTLRDIELPTVAIPDAGSDGPVSVMDAALEAIAAPVFKIGDLFKVKLVVTPVLHLSVGELVLGELEASAAVDTIDAEGIAAPLTLRDLAIDGLELDGLALDAVTA